MTLDDIAAGLASSDPENRRRAAGRLAGESGEHAAGLLIQALGDEDWRVRKEATSVAITLAPSPEILRVLVETFAPTEENVGLRNAAVEALGGYGAAAVDALGVLVHELDPDGRKLSAEALGKTGEAGALLLLRTLMEDRDPNVCAAAVEAVAAIGSTRIDEVAPLLLNYLRQPDEIQRLASQTTRGTAGSDLYPHRFPNTGLGRCLKYPPCCLPTRMLTSLDPGVWHSR